MNWLTFPAQMCIVKDRERCGGQMLAVSLIRRHNENNTNVILYVQRNTKTQNTKNHKYMVVFDDNYCALLKNKNGRMAAS